MSVCDRSQARIVARRCNLWVDPGFIFVRVADANPIFVPSASAGSQFRDSAKNDLLVNDQICFPRLRVVDDRGYLGDFDLEEALSVAKERQTDLVLVDPQVVPPLARLVHAEKYAEKQQEKEKERLKGETPEHEGYSLDPALRIKGMRFTATIDPADFERKLKLVHGFLEKGHRVDINLLPGTSSPLYRGVIPYRVPRVVPETQLHRTALPPMVLMAKKILAETRDVAKLGPYTPKSKHQRKPLNILRLWPCTPEQAARARIPTDEDLVDWFGEPPEDPVKDPDFFQWRKRRKARDIQEKGMRRSGMRKTPGGYKEE